MDNKSILIVEDERIAALDLKETLISLGYQVTGIASSGERAIEIVNTDMPDLILMDIRLSGKLSGIEAAEEILRHHAVPIIYLTAYADPELVDRAKVTRPYGYILKPADERSIRTEIEIALYKFELDRNFQREYENLDQRVTERTEDLVRMNAVLRKSETRYRLLFERSGEGIIIFEASGENQGRIVEVNAAGAAMHGYPPEELLELTITSLDAAGNASISPSQSEAIRRGEWIGGEVSHVRKDGSVFPVDFHAGLLELDGCSYVFSVMRDISEQRRIQDEIVKARDEWELTFNAVTDLITIIDKDFRVVRINKAMADRLGTTPEHAVGLCCYEAVHHSTGPPDICPHRLLLSDARPHTADIHEDSLKGDFILSVAPIFDPSGTVMGSVHVLHDITERKMVEEALKESEEKYRSILENMQDLFYRTDLDGKITMVSPSGARFTGYDSPEDLIGMDVATMYVDPEKRHEILSIITEKGAVSDYPLTLKTRDGTIRFATTNSHIYRDAQGTIRGIEGVIHDITGLRQTKDALRMANKKLNLLSSITRHDIRNQLTALKTYIQVSTLAMDRPGQLKEYFDREEMIADTIDRQISFTHDYEDMGVKSPAWQNVEAIIRATASALPLGEIRLELDGPGLEIFADPLLEKVFYNLIDNALRYGGPALATIRLSSQESGQGLIISFEDNGAGISADDKVHLFTRGFGKNTGLGLFLSREILSITGITIKETGEPGKGTRFEILVPIGVWRIEQKLS